jgi:hypothetical protein
MYLYRKAHRALQNPDLFTTEYYKQAMYAILAGLGIRLLVAIPVRNCQSKLTTGPPLTQRADYRRSPYVVVYFISLPPRPSVMGRIGF